MSKERIITALISFNEAYEELNKAWDEYDLNELNAIEKYPFGVTFENLKIKEWIEATLAEIVGKELSPTNRMVKNPRCLVCNHYGAATKEDGSCINECIDFPTTPFHAEMILAFLKSRARRFGLTIKNDVKYTPEQIYALYAVAVERRRTNGNF